MKKTLTTTIIILAIGIAMIIVGSVLQGISWSADFDGTQLASALTTIGYITAALSGIVLTGFGIAHALKPECKEEDAEKKQK